MKISGGVEKSLVLGPSKVNNLISGANNLEKQIQKLELQKETLQYQLKELTKQTGETDNKAKNNKAKEDSIAKDYILEIRTNDSDKDINNYKLSKNHIQETNNQLSEKVNQNIKDDLRKNNKMLADLQKLIQEGIDIKI